MRFNPISGTTRTIALVAIPVLAVLLALPGTTYAQRFTGDLSGTVVDESGGVIPGADVTVVNEASKGVRRSVTNNDGFFAFAALPSATYTVQISIQGFNTYEVTGIELRGGDSRTLRQISLKVATVAETVSVSAEVALTPLNSGEKSATLTGEQLENIPIQGTSAAEVLRILPGMTNVNSSSQSNRNSPNYTGEVYGINGNGEFGSGGGNNQSALGNYSANGAGVTALDITIDGAPGADPGCNCATSVNPNTEFVQEFKVLQSNFGAEHAKGPVNMTVISKQGGREFHGAVFGYVRDYHLASNEWFANKIGADKTKNKFLYPGFNLSGPLIIPGTGFNKNRDKVFFFVGFEYFKQALDTGYVKSWVPTQAMRNGDFSNAAAVGNGSAINSVPRGFPGGIIPGNLIDPGGRALVNVFPMPNADPASTGGFNYVENLLVDQNGWQGLARVDLNISDSTKMFLRYNMQREVQPFVIGLWWRNGEQQVPYPSSIEGRNRSDSGTVSLTHVFNPTLTSETIFAVTYINFPNVFKNPEKISRQALGYPYQGIFGESGDQIPSVNAGPWCCGPMYFNPGGFDPILFAEKWQIAAQDNVTKVWGTHTIKGGVYFEHVTNNQPGNGNSNGYIVLDPNNSASSGNTLADLLMGRINTHYDEQTKNALHNIGYNIFELFAQDSWKVKPRLTVDLGLRASYLGPWYDRGNYNGKTTGMVGWDQSTYQPGVQYSGLTWNSINSNTPLGIVSIPWVFTPRGGFAWDVKGTGDTVIRGGLGMYIYHEAQPAWTGSVDFAQGVRNTTISDATTLAALEGLGGGSVGLTGSTLDTQDNKQPTSYSWSLSVDQKLPWGMMAEMSYVGNHQSNQLNGGLANINAVPEYYGLQVDPTGGTNPDSLRPLNQYSDLSVFRHNMYANYHGLQTFVSRQRGKFNFTAAYTFSKILGIRGNDPNNGAFGSEYIWDVRTHNYGVLGQDRTHVASASMSWMLPDLKDKGALVNGILGNWQVSGIGTYYSGRPLWGNNGNFDIGGTGADGVPLDGQHIVGSNQIRVQAQLTCDPSQGVPDGYMLNPACFAAPTPGHNGNYVLPYMKGQPYWGLDTTLSKNFPIGSKGQKLQLRVSAYNLLNHALLFPDQSHNLTLHYTNGVMDSADFGKLGTWMENGKEVQNKFGRRVVQLVLRYTF
jgi:hypothetical protein